MSLDVSRLGGWGGLAFFRDRLPGIVQRLDAGGAMLPPAHQVFAALELTQPQDVRAVILGQDPYPTPGHAHGLAFSVAPEVQPLPRSLSNIFKEMQDDLGACPPTGDLRPWARQGVLLLNAALTVPPGAAGGHMSLGWDRLAHEVLAALDDRPRAFLLWGRPAQKLAAGIDPARHLKIETAHPSPLSARRGFFGSRPFSRVNSWLESRGEPAISWAGTEDT
ncbi:uracil-DNA glycosylase [Rhodobacteraceae bacterium 2CG4]|uniref:Uracil-DNA glycosylase n=1 Tax=Halovulum marinum TaxID=2662447 RepID=A0A6L5Z1N6_9RHOB|nr:uracil-DNA glycosylase [Halovulum marinum]MSU89914.1 uracil-DNA glycosylase [Halovulum marinum]